RWSGQYGSFGEVSHQTAESWALRQGKPTINQPLRYAGQYADSETGLHYNLFRYYDPGVGRFTTQDPIGLQGGLNLYQYAPNPLGWVDPLGLAACSPNKKTTYEGTSRRDAFRQAKRDAGIPMRQQPSAITRPDLLDGSGKKILDDKGLPVKTRQYEFTDENGKTVFIQEHSLGHAKATIGHGFEPHFNIRPPENINTGSVPGTHGHYNF
ncbi:type IV secretion protein Rhs, partial [Enterobacteriaceae bacterium BIT-l23]|nr:type IV secretion protein Rhs [Enterobacteriaceae bacterium BIT-l23]